MVPDTTSDTPAFLKGGGEMGERMRECDWSSTPLGPPQQWPDALKTLVRVMLASSQPMFVAWGPERIMLYNDGYAPMCANKHPGALGRPFSEVWADIIDAVGPIMDAAYAGRPTYMDDIAFTMMRRGYPEEAHFSFSYTPVAEDDTGEVVGMFCTCLETTADVVLSRQRAEEVARFREMFEQAPSAIALLEGPDHRFMVANGAYLELTGRRDILGKSVAEALPEVVGQGFIDLLDKVFRSGEPYLGRDVEVDLLRGPGGQAEKRVLDFIYQPVKGPDGRSTGIFVEATDVTDQRRADKQRELMVRELGHRLKNQLSVVNAIVNQSMRNASDMADARAKISQRLGALGAAHQVLLTGETRTADLGNVIAQAVASMEAITDGRISIEGPQVPLGPKAALSFSLIVHELATNALKYGALSVAGGGITITWRTIEHQGKPALEWRWQEFGGPPATAPVKAGFGTRLLRGGVAGSTGEPELRYLDTGFRYCLVLPMDAAVADN